MAKRVEPDDQLSDLRDLVASTDGDADQAKQRPDRRRMLKMAGAALLGAAGAVAVRAVPASAANGDPMVVAGTMQGSSSTLLEGNFGGTGVFVGESNATGGLGLQGSATTGVKGLGAAGGTDGGAAEVGLLGTSKSGVGTGVQGSVGAGVGVQGQSHGGTAGFFLDTNGGYDLLLGQAIVGSIADPNFHGTGRLAMVGRTDVGGTGPNIPVAFVTHSTLFNGGHFQHELIRGNDGSIWASRADVTGATTNNQFRWKRVNSVRTDASDGMGAPFKPVRVVDTRLAGPLHGPNIAGHAPYVVNVAGFGSGTSSIPPDAVAVMGNLTAVGYGGPGFMAIMPGGVVVGTSAGQYNPNADPSSINFIVGQGAIANSFVCGLHNGQLQVYVGGSNSFFIVDVTAYLQ